MNESYFYHRTGISMPSGSFLIIKFSFKMNLISTIYKINLNRMRQYKNYITVFNKNIFNNY